MGNFDLRNLAIRYPGWFSFLFLVLMIVGVYGNAKVLDLRGGILDNALPEDNIYHVMDQEARRDGFDPQEVVPIIVKLPKGLEPEGLRDVIEISQEVKKKLGGGVLSISEMPQYRDIGDKLSELPYLTPETLKRFDAHVFSSHLAADASVEGILVAQDRSWTSVVRFLPPGYSEPKEGWRIVELLEGQTIPLWKRVIKANIHPQNPNLGVSGWVAGRWQIDQGLNRDMMLLPALGFLIAFPIFWAVLRSPRQAAVASIINILGGIWLTRAAIWPLHEGYPFFHERVYTILAYANVIVQGISFSLHKFEAFRAAPGATSQEKFLEARHVDGLIGTVALIATSAFLSLNTFVVWQMREMGWQSMVGVGIVLAGTTLFIPALYLALEKIFGPEPKRAMREDTNRMGKWFIMEKRWLRILAAIVAMALPIGAFSLAALLFLSGNIETRTKPWSYITGSLVEETFQFMRDSGNEYLDLLVKPTHGDIYRAGFIREAEIFEGAVRSRNSNPSHENRFEEWQKEKGFQPILKIQEVGSILGKVSQISRESYRKYLPTTNEEVSDIFFLLDSSRLDPEVKRQLWYPGGIRFIASTVMDDSTELRMLIERVLEFAREEFPNLRVITFGKMPTFPQMDLYITKGEPANILISFLFTFLLYFFWFSRQEKRVRHAVGRVRVALIMLTPFLFAVGNMGILMWLFQIPLSMSTAPIFDLSVNATADFSLYIVWAFAIGIRTGKKPSDAVCYAFKIMGGVVIADCVLNMIAFFPLWFSAFQPVRELGWIMQLMLGSCAVGALGFIPTLLPYAVRKEIKYEHGHLRLVVDY